MNAKVTYIGLQRGFLPEDDVDLYNVEPSGTTIGVPAGSSMEVVNERAAAAVAKWETINNRAES